MVQVEPTDKPLAPQSTDESLFDPTPLLARKGIAARENNGLDKIIGVAEATGRGSSTILNVFRGKCHDLRAISDVAHIYKLRVKVVFEDQMAA